MEIELFDGRVKAIIDPEGAWLTNLSDEYGDVLFPKRTLRSTDGNAKVRGGCHVCLPNFGPGGDSTLVQHGFGRTMTWQIAESTSTSVTMVLAGGEGAYKALESRLDYAIDGNKVSMTLTVTNTGSDPLRIAPGFHPYFMAGRGESSAVITTEAVDFKELHDARFVASDQEQMLTVKNTDYVLTADNLPVWAQWTDELGSYVCVEPTVGGFTFLNTEPSDNELLGAGETRRFALQITWQR